MRPPSLWQQSKQGAADTRAVCASALRKRVDAGKQPDDRYARGRQHAQPEKQTLGPANLAHDASQ